MATDPPSPPQSAPSEADRRKGQRAILWLIILIGIGMALPPALYFFLLKP